MGKPTRFHCAFSSVFFHVSELWYIAVPVPDTAILVRVVLGDLLHDASVWIAGYASIACRYVPCSLTENEAEIQDVEQS
jgi:hypothetical protein